MGIAEGTKEDEQITLAENEIGKLTLKVASVEGKLRQHTEDANTYIVKLEQKGYDIAVEWAYVVNALIDVVNDHPAWLTRRRPACLLRAADILNEQKGE